MPVRAIHDTWAVIMMAGKGTRMKSEMPKVLHEACGQPMASWVLDACDSAGLKNRVIVVGHMADMVMERYPKEIFALQKPQKGTGHAVMVGMKKVPKDAKHIMVLSGDVPCLSGRTIAGIIKYHKKMKTAATVLSFLPPSPTCYGRMVRDRSGKVVAIVEQKDLTHEQDDIGECNSGIYVFNRAELDNALKKIKPNGKSGEYHLPDVLLHMLQSNEKVDAVGVHDWMEATGVNTRLELSEAADYVRWRTIEHHMRQGVTFSDPGSTWIGAKAKIGVDTTVHQGSIVAGETSIGKNCVIGPYTELVDVRIGNDVKIYHSVCEECRIDDDVKIGPYAHIRPGTRIRKGAKIGNFVELKKTDFGEGSKSGHLTYLGDTVVGKDVNIGAGTISCNYDGVKKSVTKIDDGVFVGSDTILVAPIKIGKNAYTAAGSTLTKDVPPDSLAFGRAMQHVKKGWVKQRKKGKKDKKNK